jgi:hypothetical protein
MKFSDLVLEVVEDWLILWLVNDTVSITEVIYSVEWNGSIMNSE